MRRRFLVNRILRGDGGLLFHLGTGLFAVLAALLVAFAQVADHELAQTLVGVISVATVSSVLFALWAAFLFLGGIAALVGLVRADASWETTGWTVLAAAYSMQLTAALLVRGPGVVLASVPVIVSLIVLVARVYTLVKDAQAAGRSVHDARAGSH